MEKTVQSELSCNAPYPTLRFPSISSSHTLPPFPLPCPLTPTIPHFGNLVALTSLPLPLHSSLPYYVQYYLDDFSLTMFMNLNPNYSNLSLTILMNPKPWNCQWQICRCLPRLRGGWETTLPTWQVTNDKPSLPDSWSTTLTNHPWPATPIRHSNQSLLTNRPDQSPLDNHPEQPSWLGTPDKPPWPTTLINHHWPTNTDQTPWPTTVINHLYQVP